MGTNVQNAVQLLAIYFLQHICSGLYKIRTKLCRHFPERVNVSADQLRILYNTSKIKCFEKLNSTTLVINNRKLQHRSLSELLIVVYLITL